MDAFFEIMAERVHPDQMIISAVDAILKARINKCIQMGRAGFPGCNMYWEPTYHRVQCYGYSLRRKVYEILIGNNCKERFMTR